MSNQSNNSKDNSDPTQDEINRAVWKACDSFRRTIDPSIYKDFVLTMLFLKYISDVWQDRYRELQDKHGDDQQTIDFVLQNERFVLPRTANFYTLHAKRDAEGNGERIDRALREIEDANEQKLRGVFQDISFNSTKLGREEEKDAILRHLFEDFSQTTLNIQSFDVIGNAYEFLIKNFASSSGKKAGEFYTPPEISLLMAHLADPQTGDEICDPTCGSGSLLLKCGQLVRDKSTSHNYSLYGQETNGSTWALAKMNMFLHGQDNHVIEWGDTIANPKLLNPQGQLKQFDVVVANPPFSLEKWGSLIAENDRFDRFHFGMPPAGRGDYAFILHMLQIMKPEVGRAVAVVPHGVLFRGAMEAKIRQKIIEANLVDAVIGVPEKLFYGTGIPAAILVFRKDKSDDSVLFIDASESYQDGKNQNSLRQEDVDRILAAYLQRRNIDHFAHLSNKQEIANNDYTLNIPRYVNTFVDEAPIDMIALMEERQQLKLEAMQAEADLEAHLKDLGLEI